ncbi:stealth conserved region 3 domain-containing protein [Weissella confusa]|uniref:stealth conserved region 3 domain-containing protein n=1 Tax=Weissella confusa TaxID=1583 RepID=UPI0022E1B75D|nr:stealth conserved region 3 domain-containing protein [Weissella confusa]
MDILVESGTVPKIDGFFHISQNGVALMNDFFNKRDVIKNNFSKFFSLKYGLTIVRTVISLPYGGFLGFLNPHLAIPYTRQDFFQFETNFPDAIQTTNAHRFREPTDINDWAVRYFRNLEGRFVPGKLKGKFLTTSQFSRDVTVSNTEQIVVINDDNHATEADIGRVISFLEAKFARKSKYEL